MTRLLPDVELLAIEVLTPVAPVSTEVPADLASKLPRLTVYKVSGAASNPRFLDKPRVHVIAWANTRQGAANLAESARVALFNAWMTQYRSVSHGGVHRVTEVAAPFEIRTGDQPDGVWRFDADYTILSRP